MSVVARSLLLLVLSAGCVLCAPQTGEAQSRRQQPAEEKSDGPVRYTSRNFLLYTDMPQEEAQDLLDRLEKMLRLISQYWARPNRKTIEMYVVKDLENWPVEKLHLEGLASIQSGGGLTITRVVSQGNRFNSKSVVYAIADRGTPQHEAVHAYCAQTFGRTGPVWYSEGMAEMGQYWQEDDAAVNCHPFVVEYLKSEEPRDLLELVDADQVTGDSWQNYAWRWALCHLLANNPNYAPRFRPLGLGLLTNQNVSFEQVYGSMAKEIKFEYEFFLEHFDIGYRADLCAWDWKAKATPTRGSNSKVAKIKADHGWQSGRAFLVEGEKYDYAAEGAWSIDDEETELTADGGEDGLGKLVGAIFDDDRYTLSEPLELGSYGTFTAPQSGHFVLRCQDKWNELANNKGTVTIRFRKHDADRPLPMPE